MSSEEVILMIVGMKPSVLPSFAIRCVAALKRVAVCVIKKT